MLADQRKHPRTQREHVSVENAVHCRLWCKRLDCTEEELRRGVQATDSKVENVRLHLKVRRSVRAAVLYGRIYGTI